MLTPAHRWLLLPALAVTILVAGGCGNDAASDVGYFDDDDFPGNCAGTGAATTGCDTDGTGSEVMATSTTGTPQTGCQQSGDCDGGYCLAPYDPETTEVGAFDCSFTCIPLMDEFSWCSDDTACCDPDAVCTERGYCLLPEDIGGTDESTSGGSTSTGSTTSSGSTTADGSSTGATDSTGTGSTGTGGG